jgi:hypothetical protein
VLPLVLESGSISFPLRQLHRVFACLPALVLAFPDGPPNDPGRDSRYNSRGGNAGDDTPDPTVEFPLASDAADNSGMTAGIAWRAVQKTFCGSALGRPDVPDVAMAGMKGGVN